MGKKASLSEVQRAEIVTLHKEGYAERAISERVGCSKTAVHQAVVKFQTKRTYTDTKRSGRPRKTSPRDDHIIRRTAVRSPTSSANKIRSALLAKGVNVSRRTVSRRLVDDFGLKSHKPAKKPRLTPAMKVKRLRFAKKHVRWTLQQWQQVFFSDESTIQQFNVRKRHVRRPVGKRYEERYTSQAMKHPPSVMIWGGMSVNGTAGLFFLAPGMTMNGTRYADLLREELERHMDIHKCTIFMHDGAPCHRSKTVTQFLESKKIQTLDWPGNSTDMNPIESLWTVLKDRVSEKQPTSAMELETAIKEVWASELSAEYCRSLVESMPRRLEAVIKAKGGPTKY